MRIGGINNKWTHLFHLHILHLRIRHHILRRRDAAGGDDPYDFLCGVLYDDDVLIAIDLNNYNQAPKSFNGLRNIFDEFMIF